jgi:hypothetical protein
MQLPASSETMRRTMRSPRRGDDAVESASQRRFDAAVL